MPSIFSNPKALGFLAGQKKKPQAGVSTDGLNSQAPGSFTQFSMPTQVAPQENMASDWIGNNQVPPPAQTPPPPQNSPPPPPKQQDERDGNAANDGGGGGANNSQGIEEYIGAGNNDINVLVDDSDLTKYNGTSAEDTANPYWKWVKEGKPEGSSDPHYIKPKEGSDPNANGIQYDIHGQAFDASGNPIENVEEYLAGEAQKTKSQDYLEAYFKKVMEGQDFSPVQQGIDEERDKAIRQLAESMASRGMGASGAESSMAGDIYRGAARDIASSRMEFEQQKLDNMSKAAEMLMGDKWKQMDINQQNQMAEYMLEHEKEIFDYVRKKQSGDPGQIENFWDDFLSTTKKSMPWNWGK
jgi:hypothetical protein